MKKVLLFLTLILFYSSSFSQAGSAPVQFCSSAIPEICNGSLYPASTSGNASAPFGANLNCGFNDISENASFYYFVSNTNGPLNGSGSDGCTIFTISPLYISKLYN